MHYHSHTYLSYCQSDENTVATHPAQDGLSVCFLWQVAANEERQQSESGGQPVEDDGPAQESQSRATVVQRRLSTNGGNNRQGWWWAEHWRAGEWVRMIVERSLRRGAVCFDWIVDEAVLACDT